MPRDQAKVTCPVGVWTELTNSDATAITFQVVSGSIKVRTTTGSAPSNLSDDGFVYHAHPTDRQTEDGELNITLSDFTPTAGADRVFATPIGGRRAVVVVSHA